MDIFVYSVLAVIIVVSFLVIRNLNQELKERTNYMLSRSFNQDLDVGEEVLFSKTHKGIILKCPTEGQTYTVLCKNGSVKFIKENNMILTGQKADGLVKFLEAWGELK